MYRYRGLGGVEKTWHPTVRDQQIVLECSRWAMLTAWDIATRVLPVDDWYLTPEQVSDGPKPLRTEGLDVSLNAVKRVRERLTRLTNNYPHPLMSQTLRGQFAAVYQATGSGNLFVGIDAAPSRISPSAQSYSMKSGHMLAAARVGRCLELGGYRVLSEKEAATNIALDGGPVPPDLVSYYRSTREAKPVEKKPDLILPTADATGYIAVEVELARHRQPSVYETKLAAYADNPACKGVIYVTNQNSVLERVNAATVRVHGHDGTPPVVVQRLHSGTRNAVNHALRNTQHLYAQCARLPEPAPA